MGFSSSSAPVVGVQLCHPPSLSSPVLFLGWTLLAGIHSRAPLLFSVFLTHSGFSVTVILICLSSLPRIIVLSMSYQQYPRRENYIYLARLPCFEETPLEFGIALLVCIYQLPYQLSYMESTESSTMQLHSSFWVRSGKKLGFKHKSNFKKIFIFIRIKQCLSN